MPPQPNENHRAGDKNSTHQLVITYNQIYKGQVILPKALVGRVLWEELFVLSSFTLKSEGETNIF